MANSTVDIHILTTPDTNPQWLYECLRSMVNEPVNIWLTRGVVGNIGLGRLIGFSCGTSEYVSFADHDDILMPGVIQQCIDHLDSNPDTAGVYTDQLLIDRDGNAISEGWSSQPDLFSAYADRLQLVRHPDGGYIHHLLVFRRNVLNSLTLHDKPRIVEPYLIRAICKYGRLDHIPAIGYKWRIHEGNTFSTFSDQEIHNTLSGLQE